MNSVLIIQAMGVMAMLVGAVVGFFFLRNLFYALRSRHWPAAVGRLHHAGLQEVEYEGKQPGGGITRAGAMAVDFSYEYEVDGQRYQGKRVTFSDHVNKSRGMVERLLDSFRHVRVIRVFYDPRNPSRSVLLPGPRLSNFTSLISPLGFFSIGLFLFVRGPGLI